MHRRRCATINQETKAWALWCRESDTVGVHRRIQTHKSTFKYLQWARLVFKSIPKRYCNNEWNNLLVDRFRRVVNFKDNGLSISSSCQFQLGTYVGATRRRLERRWVCVCLCAKAYKIQREKAPTSPRLISESVGKSDMNNWTFVSRTPCWNESWLSTVTTVKCSPEIHKINL